MDFFESFTNAFTTAGKKARRAYDSTKLELRVKGYEKEQREAFNEIGRIIYKSRKTAAAPDDARLEELFSMIDNISFRIAQLNKTIQEIKKQNNAGKPKADGAAVQEGDIHDFAKLSRKDGDLKIRRTAEGIQVLRFCTACGGANPPTEAACAACGYVFRKMDEEKSE